MGGIHTDTGIGRQITAPGDATSEKFDESRSVGVETERHLEHLKSILSLEKYQSRIQDLHIFHI